MHGLQARQGYSQESARNGLGTLVPSRAYKGINNTISWKNESRGSVSFVIVGQLLICGRKLPEMVLGMIIVVT